MRNDNGVSLIMVTISLMLLMGAAAIAIDLAALRLDRSVDQKVTDSAASAGALAALETGSGQEACEAAVAYVAINSEEIGTLDASSCANFTTSSCNPAAPHSENFTSGRFGITVTYPVPDGDPLMTSGLLGAPTQSVVAEDRDPCERVGVAMSAEHEGLFARLLGFGRGTTNVHSVATAFIPDGDGVPLNLLVLDRFGCNTIHVQGNGGVIVNAVINEAGTGLIQGIAASDSDTSAGCTTEEEPSALHIEGSNAVFRADGPICASQTGTGTVGGFTSGHGCGSIQSFAPGTPGCNAPACTPGAGGANPPNPELIEDLPGRLTRAPVDYRYNCWPDYTSPPAGVGWAVDALTTLNEQDIPGCTKGTAANIYSLINTVGPSGAAGGTAWNADLGHPCNVPASSPQITVGVGPGPVFIDCDDFIVEGEVSINSRDVVLRGNVHVKSDGLLEIQNPVGTPGWAFFRNGTFTKDGQASINIQFTAVYLSKTSTVNIAGGDKGTLAWVAPNSGVFDDLALWSDSPLVHSWAGQGLLKMEGVFFTPLATGEYSGTSGQNQTDAQWVADKLVARGQGVLAIQPEFGRAVEFPLGPRTTLIR